MTQQPNQPSQSPHWIDQLTSAIQDWQTQQAIPRLHVDDMKTPSGRVHTGALRGVVLHDLVAQALKSATQQDITSTYVFNDMDPMDGLPTYLNQSEYQAHMGKPLYTIPAPKLEESGIDFSKADAETIKKFQQAKSFAEFYALDFIEAFQVLGCTPTIVWSHELYESGKMDPAIRTALDNVTTLREIYQEVAEYTLPEKWYPFQVFCPQCGKVGTTLVTDWNGEIVSFECQKNKVEWAQGCGFIGQVSPFGGTGKLLWKVDWPAHWKTLGVTVEGAGKDHTSAGGSRDMAAAECRQVFMIPEPFDIPYEWILIRGAKMSSSKGIGTSAREFVTLFPPTVGRFLFASKHYNQVIDFDPATMAIPDLFDEYDQAARIFWGEETGDLRLGRSFAISQIGETPPSHFLPRFRDIAIWMQHPELDLATKFAEVKGSPLTEFELRVLSERQTFALQWVNLYAPAEFQLSPLNTLPEAAHSLSTEQRTYLQVVEQLLTDTPNWEPTDLQQKLFELAKSSLGARQGFEAIYLAFLGKKSGPRAAWFLLAIKPELRTRRISEINNLIK